MNYIFDMDGTLIDSMPVLAKSIIGFLEDNNTPYPEDLIKIVIPLGFDASALYYQSLGVQMTVEEIGKDLGERMYYEYANNIPAKPYVKQALESLISQGHTVSVLTASPHLTVDPCLKRLGLYDMFKYVWSCDDFGTTKADVNIYYRVAEKLGTTVSECVFLDDNLGSVSTAKESGMKVIAVYDSYSEEYKHDMKAVADKYIYSFSELYSEGKPKTLYITDLDGTLLNEKAELSDYARDTLNDLISHGLNFTIASARTSESTKVILSGLNLSIPGVLQNGVYLYDFKTDSYSDVFAIDNDAKAKLIDIVHKHNLSGFIYTLESNKHNVYYKNTSSLNDQRFIDERVTLYGKVFTKVRDFNDISDKKVVSYSVSDKPEKLEAAYHELESVSGLRTEFYRDIYCDGLWCLEVFNEKASKGSSVSLLRERYFFDRVIGFGDNLNDLHLFSACDESYAVSNAKSEVIRNASGVVGESHSDGVVRWLAANAVL
ncbi:MAG: HAD-IIB family hydrolase [Clostridiales bacterium]|nr:HAD-IIB family hydrolase [Clostridiales bacterium]